MAAPPLQGFGVTHGFIATEESPNRDRMYVTPEQCEALYCMSVTEAQIRFAMDLMHGYVNRPSLWPETYSEQLSVPEDRNQIILAARPVIKVISLSGRYGYSRRDRRDINYVNYDLGAVTALFGSPPGWIPINVPTAEVQPASGEVWLPSGFFLQHYSEVRVTYLSGLINISSRVKSALLEIINTTREKGVSDRTQYSVGRVSRSYAKPGFLSDTAKQLLEPFVIRSLY